MLPAVCIMYYSGISSMDLSCSCDNPKVFKIFIWLTHIVQDNFNTRTIWQLCCFVSFFAFFLDLFSYMAEVVMVLKYMLYGAAAVRIGL